VQHAGEVGSGRDEAPAVRVDCQDAAVVLAALGVVKMATAEQIQQLMCPGTAGAQIVRNGCLVLGRDGRVEPLGSASRTNAEGNLASASSGASTSARKRWSGGRRSRPRPSGSPIRCARSARGRWRAAPAGTTRGKRERCRPAECIAPAAAFRWPSHTGRFGRVIRRLVNGDERYPRR